jgi:hypothetical protein
MDIKDVLMQLSSQQLQQALDLKQQIERLEAELHSLVSGGGAGSPRGRQGKRQLSEEARERIAAAQRARWAKVRGGSKSAGTNGAKVKSGSGNAAAPAAKGGGKRKMTPAQRAKIAEAARKRWADAKAAGRTRL